MSNECPCEYCAKIVFKTMKAMLGVIFDWFYYECKFDESKTYTWTELMDVYLILRYMNGGKTLEEAQKLLKEESEK